MLKDTKNDEDCRYESENQSHADNRQAVEAWMKFKRHVCVEYGVDRTKYEDQYCADVVDVIH